LKSRRVPPDRLVTPELARAMTELSLETQRQIGLLINRQGRVREVMVGDARSVFIPDLSAYRRGFDRLCGLRLVHTHLKGEPLSDDDFTDLSLLRLDAVSAIAVEGDGLPGHIETAHLLPSANGQRSWETLPKISVHDLDDDFLELVTSLEDEFARVRGPRAAGDLRDRAVLIHVGPENAAVAEDSLAELAELARSAGIVVAHRIIQRRQPDPRTVMGKGKLQEAVIEAMRLGAEALVFDLNLAPTQVQTLATMTDLKILDRTQVILDIFAQHAQAREGKIQVELAQLRYMLPRLGAQQSARAFSRLTGGIGGRGPGETKLEIDRRRAQSRIAQLEREVSRLGDRRDLRRRQRDRNQLPIVSIVGYTNAGKSTLLNRLTQSDVTAEDALFATLNPVSRRLRFPKEREIIMTDTVGFIRALPDELLAAFRTTLEELQHADLLLHVVDASSTDVDDKVTVVESMLADLGLQGKPKLCVLNKSDKCDPDTLAGLERRYDAVSLSALNRDTFGPLMERLEELLWSDEHAQLAT
jgi:GTPase